MHVDMCMDMCLDIHIDMCIDICIHTYDGLDVSTLVYDMRHCTERAVIDQQLAFVCRHEHPSCRHECVCACTGAAEDGGWALHYLPLELLELALDILQVNLAACHRCTRLTTTSNQKYHSDRL